MVLRVLGRCGAAAMFLAMVVGCSSSDDGGRGGLFGANDGASGRVDECKASRRACIYEGRYERDERDYAELEARRLNQAQLNRLRRSSR